MSNRFIRPVATLSAATLAALLGTAGLAVAGVDLPDPAKNAFQRAGITLPNQAGGGQSGEHCRADDVRSVLEATPPSERGCAFGHSVAEAAKGSALPDQAQDACDQASENAEAKSTAAGGSSHSQFGRETSERAKGLQDATVDERQELREGDVRAAPGRTAARRTARRARTSGARPRPTAGAPRGHAQRSARGHAERSARHGARSGRDAHGPPAGTPSGRP